jgi:pimeloyl-ACP methyl ester carboxylesterase
LPEPTTVGEVTLVLLPGMDGTGDLFEPLLAELGSSLTTQVVRYPSAEPLGYDALTAIARRALPCAGPYVILGESFSGPIAIRLASQRPAGLTGLILCASFVSNPTIWLRALQAVLGAVPIGLLAHWLAPWRLMGRFRTPERTALLLRTLARVPDGVLRARLRAVMAVNVSSQLSRVEAPIMYLQGTEDGLIRQRVVDAAMCSSRSMQVRRVVGPHCLLQCSAQEAAREIREFAGRSSVREVGAR